MMRILQNMMSYWRLNLVFRSFGSHRVKRVRVIQVAVLTMFIVLLLLLVLQHLVPRDLHLTPKAEILHEVPMLSREKNSSQPVLTRDIYVAGHKRPHPELCPSLGAKIQLLILVTSAPLHFAARNAIRMTWGHYGLRSDISFGFFIGIPPSDLKSSIEAEDTVYGDIIVGRFIDSYRNLTIKSISMLEWVDTYCPRVPKMLKTDDDMFINVPVLLKFIKAPLWINATKTIWGDIRKNARVVRKKLSKYFVSPKQYPGKVFPLYVRGAAYLLTTDIIKDILIAAPNEPYINIEDAYITGILGNKLMVKRLFAEEFGYILLPTAHPCVAKRVLAVHMDRTDQHFLFWRNLFDDKNLSCL